MHLNVSRLSVVALLLLLQLCTLSHLVTSVHAQGCQNISQTSICSKAINYQEVYVAASCQDYQEHAVSNMPNILSVLQNAALGLPSGCSDSFSQLSCSKAFPNCLGQAPCQSMCQQVISSCGGSNSPVVALLSNFADLNCTNYATSGCYAPASSFTPSTPSPPRCDSYQTLSGGKGVCASVINYPIYIPQGTVFQYLEGTASQLISSILSFIPGGTYGTACQKAFLRQTCTNVFQACDSTVLSKLGFGQGALVPFPQFPCRGDCYDYKARCVDSGLIPAAVFKQLPSAALQFLKPDCTSTGTHLPQVVNCNVTVPGSVAGDDFPVTQTTYPASAPLPSIDVACDSFVNTSNIQVPGATCAPLKSTSFCKNVLQYASSVSVIGPCMDFQENALSQVPNILAVLNNPSLNLSSACPAAVSAYACATAYPTCPDVLTPCASMCGAVVQACGGPNPATSQVLGLLSQFMNLNCSQLPTSSCYAPPAAPAYVPPAPSCGDYNALGGSFCADVIGTTPIYIPAGATFAQLEGAATQLGAAMSFMPASTAGTQCKKSFKKQVCSNVFLACDATVLPKLGLPAPVPFPQFECRSDCNTYRADCVDSGILSSSVTSQFPDTAKAFLLPNCTGTGNKVPPTTQCGTTVSPGMEDFPTTQSTYPGISVIPAIPVQCNNHLPATSSISVPSTPCETLRSTSFCANVLPTSYTSSVNVFGTCQDYQENALGSAGQLLSALTGLNVSSACVPTVSKYLCVTAYPNCQGQAPCSSMCSDIIRDCGGANPSTSVALGVLGQFVNMKCSSLPTSDCYAPSTTDVFVPQIPSLPRCSNYIAEGGSVCAGIIDYPIYIPQATTFGYLEGTVSQLSFLYNFIPSGVFGDACYRAFTRQMCTNVFQGCDDTVLSKYGIPAPFPFPRFACRDDCESYKASCALPDDILAQLPAAAAVFIAPNCTGQGYKFPAGSACGNPTGSPGLPDFPISSTTFPASGLPPLVTQCNAIGVNKTSAIAVVSHCPLPLLYSENPANGVGGTVCAVPCPVPLYSVAEYKVTDTMSTVFAVMSVVVNGFLLFTWILFDSKRKQTFVLMFCVNVFLLTAALLVGVITTNGHPSRQGCKNDIESWTQDDTHAYCAWEGAFIHVFSLSAVLWWSVISFDLFALLVLGLRLTKRQTQFKTMGYFFYAQGMPIIMSFAVAARKGYGDNAGLSWCFIDTEPPAMEYVVFWAPLIGCMVLGALCIFALFGTLYKSSRATGNSKKAGAWKQYVRPMLFLTEFFVVFAFVVGYKFNGRAHNDEYVASITDYVTCLLGPGGNQEMCGDHSKLRPSLALWRGFHFVFIGQGVLNFIVYGTQWNNYQLWLNFCFAGLGFSQRGSTNGTDESDLGRSSHNSRTRERDIEMRRTNSGRELQRDGSDVKSKTRGGDVSSARVAAKPTNRYQEPTVKPTGVIARPTIGAVSAIQTGGAAVARPRLSIISPTGVPLASPELASNPLVSAISTQPRHTQEDILKNLDQQAAVPNQLEEQQHAHDPNQVVEEVRDADQVEVQVPQPSSAVASNSQSQSRSPSSTSVAADQPLADAAAAPSDAQQLQ